MINVGRRALSARPFSVLLGAELLQLGDELAGIEISIRPDLLQQHGYVQGGVLSYLVDNAMAFAAGSVLGSNVLSANYE